MIYFELLLGFLKVGCFSFGGAYGAIPLIRDVVTSYNWLDEEMLTYIIAVGESSPGPIMVNLATYVGSTQAGFCGADGGQDPQDSQEDHDPGTKAKFLLQPDSQNQKKQGRKDDRKAELAYPH